MLAEGICQTCGRSFTAPAPRRGRVRQTCSRSCAARGTRRRTPLAERFWRHVQRTDTCWLWTGLHRPSGAGVLTIREAGRVRQVSAAQVSWELHIGPVPPARRLWRRCRRPACIRPDHLMLVRRGSTATPTVTDGPATAAGRAEAEDRPKHRLQVPARRQRWTLARVLAGLQSFWQATGCAPTTSLAWTRLTAAGAMGAPARRYPSAYAVLRHFPSFRAAWAAAGIPLTHARWAPWTRAEEEYLVRTLGVRPTAEIAATLGRGEAAIRSRARHLGLHVSDAYGWPLQRVAHVAGVPEHVLRGYVDRGELPVFKGAKHVFIDVGDLVVVEEIDWMSVSANLEAAVRRSLRWRLVRVLAGRDWRRLRPHQPRPAAASGRRGCYRGVPRTDRPMRLGPGTWVHVARPVPGAPWCHGRSGQLLRVYWSTSPRLAAPEWRALVCFPKQRRRQVGATMTYSVPASALEPAPPRSDSDRSPCH